MYKTTLLTLCNLKSLRLSAFILLYHTGNKFDIKVIFFSDISNYYKLDFVGPGLKLGKNAIFAAFFQGT